MSDDRPAKAPGRAETTGRAKAAGRAQRGPQPPRPLTVERLHKAALNHLARYACSSEQLRRVLRRRLQRAEAAGVAEIAEADVEREIERCRRLGFLDDTAFARQKAESLGRQGRSRQAIGQKLKQLGLAEGEVESGLAAAGTTTADELARAAAYARRRRLGPFRPPAERAERLQRDLAALGRQGFPYGLARQVLEAEDEAALERLVADAA